MVSKIHKLIESVRVKNSEHIEAVNKDLFKLLCDEKFFVLVRNEIIVENKYKFSSKELSIFNLQSEFIVKDLVNELKDQRFEFTTNGLNNKIPLETYVTKDKLVEKAILIIIESIYAPVLLKYKNGSKQYKGFTDPLLEIRKNWVDLKWGIEGRIHRLHEKVDHHILISILRMKIQDERFIQLIWKLIQRGQDEKTNKFGLMSMSIDSEILVDIYLNEFDLFVEKLINTYKSSYSIEKNFFDKKLRQYCHRLTILRSHPSSAYSILPFGRSKSHLSDHFIVLKVVRYSGHLIIGIKGPKLFAEIMTAKIKSYLYSSLNLRIWSETQTIKRFSTGYIDFLGYNIKPSQVSKSKLELFVPTQKIIHMLSEENFSDKSGCGIKKKGWIIYSDALIIAKYNRIFHRFKKYYYLASNYKIIMRRVKYIMQYSCAHTLASKHRTNVSTQISRIRLIGLFNSIF